MLTPLPSVEAATVRDSITFPMYINKKRGWCVVVVGVKGIQMRSVGRWLGYPKWHYKFKPGQKPTQKSGQITEAQTTR